MVATKAVYGSEPVLHLSLSQTTLNPYSDETIKQIAIKVVHV
jgi:hypothetical protein